MFRVHLERRLCSQAGVEREEARRRPFWRLCNRKRHSWAQEKGEALGTGVRIGEGRGRRWGEQVEARSECFCISQDECMLWVAAWAVEGRHS